MSLIFACVNTGFEHNFSAGRRQWKAKIAIILASACIVSACNVTKHLDESKDERLVVSNKVELKSPQKISLSDKTSLLYELDNLYKIKPNERVLRMFYFKLWAHYKYRDKKSNFADWVNKRIAEEPALYDQELTEKTVKNFTNYLNQRGYFDASCAYKNDTLSEHKIATTYLLDMGDQYAVDTVSWLCPDSAVLSILNELKGSSAVKAGAPLDGQLFEKEKLRITDTLKNRGYAYFVPNFIEFLGDSSGNKVQVTVDVGTPTDSTNHPVYTIGSIQVFTSLVPDLAAIRRDTTINGVYYATSEQKFSIKPEKLHAALAVHSGTLYRQADLDRTSRNLNALGTFRFASVTPYQDSIDPSRQNVIISLTPNDRLSIGGGFDINASNSEISSDLIGLSVSGNMRNRNVFGGAENVTTDISYSLEFDVSSPDQLIFSQELAINNQMSFPRFFDFIGWWKNLHGIRIGTNRLLSDKAYSKVKQNARPLLNLNYNRLNLIDFYDYDLINASFGYSIYSDPGRQMSINIPSLDVLRPTLEQRFYDIYGDSSLFSLSFEEQLFTSLFFRNFSFSLYTNPNRFGEHNFFRFEAELSGLEVETANEIWGMLFQPEEWSVGNLEYARFFRINMDGGYIRQFNNEITLAARIGAGVAHPFGGTKVTPYVKQFFVGGPSSIRAFRIREIGPGGFFDPRAPEDPPFANAADFRFEFNAELRFPLFFFFKGAVFVDGGNIWSVNNADNRPFSHLEWDSYKQIALGTGFGVRLDIDYIVMRLDMGLPLRYPRFNNGYWVDYFNGAKWKFNYNLSVGYPF